jgi:hypothetical protein
VQFQPSRFYFSHAIAIAKATMAMVGHFQPNPKKRYKATIKSKETQSTRNYDSIN